MADDRATNEPGVVTKLSPRPVADTTARLTELLSAKRVKLFTVIDQSAEARQVGLELRDTTLVIFGNPAAVTGSVPTSRRTWRPSTCSPMPSPPRHDRAAAGGRASGRAAPRTA